MNRSEARSHETEVLDLPGRGHRNVQKPFRDGEKVATDAQALQPIIAKRGTR